MTDVLTTGQRMRRSLFLVVTMVIALALASVAPALANGQGNGAAPDRGNSLISASEPLEVTEVLAQQSDPSQANFEEEFTFYRVTFEEVTYTNWVYREPPRLGGENFVLGTIPATDTNRFWYGVSAPDNNGIQHEIVHKGTVWSYYETADGWKHLKAQFNGQGELLNVNGVAPE